MPFRHNSLNLQVAAAGGNNYLVKVRFGSGFVQQRYLRKKQPISFGPANPRLSNPGMENGFQNLARGGIMEHQVSYPVSGEIAFGIAYSSAESRFNLLLYNEIAVRQSSGFEI